MTTLPTQQETKYDKWDLYNTCTVPQLSQNKYYFSKCSYNLTFSLSYKDIVPNEIQLLFQLTQCSYFCTAAQLWIPMCLLHVDKNHQSSHPGGSQIPVSASQLPVLQWQCSLQSRTKTTRHTVYKKEWHITCNVIEQHKTTVWKMYEDIYYMILVTYLQTKNLRPHSKIQW